MGLDGHLVHARTPLLMSAWDGVTILWLNAFNDVRVDFTLLLPYIARFSALFWSHTW